MGQSREHLRDIKNSRIEKICENIEKTDVLIDVGTDHAYLPIFCIKNGLIKKAVATDINQKPLNKAKRSIKLDALDEYIDVVLCDGLGDIPIPPYAVIIIAGLGGEQILGIIDRSKDDIGKNNSLILQPMTAPEILKKYLLENGFDIIKEVFFEFRKYTYILFKCKKVRDEQYELDKYCKESYIPECFDNKDKTALKKYMQKVIRRQKKILDGYIATKNSDTKKQIKLIEEIEGFYESI